MMNKKERPGGDSNAAGLVSSYSGQEHPSAPTSVRENGVSNAEMISKTGGALQKLEETVYWLELLTEAQVKANSTADLQEVKELLRILVSGVKTVKAQVR